MDALVVEAAGAVPVDAHRGSESRSVRDQPAGDVGPHAGADVLRGLAGADELHLQLTTRTADPESLVGGDIEHRQPGARSPEPWATAPARAARAGGRSPGPPGPPP